LQNINQSMKKHKNSESTTQFFFSFSQKGSSTSEENQIKMRCLWLEYLLLLCVKSNSNRKKCETCRHCRKKNSHRKLSPFFMLLRFVACLVINRLLENKRNIKMEMTLKVDKHNVDLNAFSVILYDLCPINFSQQIKSQTHFQYQKLRLKTT